MRYLTVLGTVRYATVRYDTIKLARCCGRRKYYRTVLQIANTIVRHCKSQILYGITLNELYPLTLLTDEHDISIRTMFIRSAANVWADRLSRETDNSDWQLVTRVSRYYDKIWGPHSVDHFASFANK